MGSSDRESKRRRSFSWNYFRFRHRVSAKNLVVAAICTMMFTLNVYQFQSNQQPDSHSQEHDDASQEALLNKNDRYDPWFSNSDNKNPTIKKDDTQHPTIKLRREILAQAPANNMNNNNMLSRNEILSDKPTFVTEEKKDFAFAHVIAVLQRLGFQKKRLAEEKDWDVFWAFDLPFYGSQWPDLHNLKPHQRVNHIPSTLGMPLKVVLATSGISGIPPGFAIPKDADKLRRYAQDNPDALFVKKGIHHRGISILKVKDLDLKNTNSFVQEFIRDPLLIDGYKFELGVYTIVTSIDPLRVFTYDADVIVRFCTEKYLPLDAANLAKYVVADKTKPFHEIEPMKKYFHMGLSMKESLNAHIASLGKDPSVIWTKFEEIARTVMYRNERHWIEGLRKFKSKSNRNFFELFRLDFIVSEDLDVHLMEINSSPNLNSVTAPIKRQRFEQLLFNTFSLLNIARKTRSNSLKTSSMAEYEMTVFEKNLGVFPKTCTSDPCLGSCEPLDCKLCKRCLTTDTRQMLEDAFIEDQNRMSFKRIVPPAVAYKDVNKPLGNLSEANQLMLRWFQGKCLQDKEWCSW